ncbi:hypothetical protein [Paludifilum halophilum]|nr:hypothetical protein [Paludifilum halophilum]
MSGFGLWFIIAGGVMGVLGIFLRLRGDNAGYEWMALGVLCLLVGFLA